MAKHVRKRPKTAEFFATAAEPQVLGSSSAAAAATAAVAAAAAAAVFCRTCVDPQLGQTRRASFYFQEVIQPRVH